MAGALHPALIGVAGTVSLIAVRPAGGAGRSRSHGEGPDCDELFDNAAMEFGTD